MAQRTNSNKNLSVEYGGFEGIDTKARHSGGIQDALNLRILPDGSLQKRQGYKCIYSNSLGVRAIWSGIIGGSFSCYFLSRNSVYKLDVSTGEATFCAAITTSVGKAQFFYFRDALYLTDTKRIYKVLDDSAEPIVGYVPLFGKDWGTGTPGEINEPLNILHRYARITYKIGESFSSYLPTLNPVSEIRAVYKNGELLSPEAYSFDERFNTINIAGLESGDELEAVVAFVEEDSTLRSELLSSPFAYVFGGINNSRLFLWGGEIDNTIYTSTYVSRESLAKAEKSFSGCGHIYFCEGNQFTVGDGRYSIKAVTRHFDRLLILTEGDAWIADSSTCGEEEFPIMNVNSRMGCFSEGGVVSIGNDPVSVGRRAVFRWTSDTDELNECNAYSISDEIAELLSPTFFKNAVVYADEGRGELWFCDPTEDGVAWIYNVKRSAWSRFTNIKAEAFFDANGEVGFISEGRICVFKSECYADYENPDDTVGTPISASLVSGFIDFNSPKSKRLRSMILFADLEGGRINARIFSDRDEQIDASVVSSTEHSPYVIRLHSHRMGSLSFRLSADGEERQTIHRLKIEAR